MSKKKGLFPYVGFALDTPVKGRKSNVGNLKAAKDKIKRVTDKSTEAMVKVTGGARGSKHLKAHMDYISRNGNVELENENGQILDTREAIRDEHKKWADDLGKTRANVKDSVNIVLSMPAGTEPEAVRVAAREFAKERFGETNAYLMALHHPGNDPKTKQPHVHLTVKALGYDGTKLHLNKADLQEMRERFAGKMRDQGYDVEATPRRSRGVIEKGIRHIVHAIATDRERPGRSTVQAAKIKEAAAALAGKPVSENPYKKQIAERQSLVRKSWLEGAKALDSTGLQEDRELARKIRGFVSNMPTKLKDERTRLQEQLLKEIERKRGTQHKDRDQKPQQQNKDKDHDR